jgi:hypothetical protein
LELVHEFGNSKRFKSLAEKFDAIIFKKLSPEGVNPGTFFNPWRPL